MGKVQRLLMQQAAVADAWAIGKEAERVALDKASAASKPALSAGGGEIEALGRRPLFIVVGCLLPSFCCRRVLFFE